MNYTYKQKEKATKVYYLSSLLGFMLLQEYPVCRNVDKTTGYIKINRFAEKTYDEFLSGLTQLKKEGAKHIIIDLRDNGGGYLESAVAIADEFLKNKELIVKTKNKKDVLNRDLWQELFELKKDKNIKWKKVLGHSGNKLNDRCDEIATSFADGKKIDLYDGPKNSYIVS